MKPIQTLSHLPHHHTISYHKNREAWALVHKIRNEELVSSLRALKERQGQNWPVQHLLPNFSKKIRVAPFIFNNHWLSTEINLFLKPGVPLKGKFSILMISIIVFCFSTMNACEEECWTCTGRTCILWRWERISGLCTTIPWTWVSDSLISFSPSRSNR